MDNIVNITLENFQQVILDTSKEKFVMVQFWADWSEPCTELTPVLAKLAKEYANDLVLARVNCDEQQEIVGQFGVRSLPTVMLVKDGQPIDGFAGVQPEQQIRELLDKHLPKAEDELFHQAMQFVSAGDYTQAFTLAKQAYDLNSDNVDIKFLLIDCYIELGQVNQAKELLAGIGLVDQDGRYQSLQGKIELAEQAADSPEIQTLQQALAQDPDNMELKVTLAVQLHQVRRSEEALELLFSVLNKDLNFAEAKKTTLEMINALADGDPLKSKYRRKIYSLLY